MAKITEEQIAKTKAANPGVEMHLLEAEPWDESIIVRVPTEANWMKWRNAIREGENIRGAQKDLVNDSLLFPTPLEMSAIYDRRPALVEEFASGISKIAGVIQSVKAKKL